MLVIIGAFSGFKATHPMTDKSAESTMEAIRHYKVDRTIGRFYSERSGEIERALRELEIVAEQSQPGVPQNNAVAERLVQDLLEGARTALVRACLPLYVWEFSCRHYCMAENFLPRRKSAAADGDRSSPWGRPTSPRLRVSFFFSATRLFSSLRKPNKMGLPRWSLHH